MWCDLFFQVRRRERFCAPNRCIHYVRLIESRFVGDPLDGEVEKAADPRPEERSMARWSPSLSSPSSSFALPLFRLLEKRLGDPLTNSLGPLSRSPPLSSRLVRSDRLRFVRRRLLHPSRFNEPDRFHRSPTSQRHNGINCRNSNPRIVSMYVYTHIHTHMYIYIYIKRRGGREGGKRLARLSGEMREREGWSFHGAQPLAAGDLEPATESVAREVGTWYLDAGIDRLV